MSPSSISLMRAPASRISATRSSCRGRSSTIAVTSPTCRPNASAIASRFSPTGRRRSIRPLATGPTAIFFMYMRGQRREAARVGRRQDRERALAPACHRRAVSDRVAGQIERRPAAAQLAALRQRVALLVAADHEPCREIGTRASASTIASDAAWSAAVARRRGPGTGRRRARSARSPRSARCSGTARRLRRVDRLLRSRRRRGHAHGQGTAAWRAVARSRIRSMTAISA